MKRGPQSGPLPASTVREGPRSHARPEPATILRLPADVVATLHVLVEIELCRRERILPKAKPNLDVVRATQDDAVLK